MKFRNRFRLPSFAVISPACLATVVLLLGPSSTLRAQPDKVNVIDTNPFSPGYFTVITSVPLPSGPEWVAVTPDGTRAYITNEIDNSVSVLRVADNSIITTIRDGMGHGPEKIAIRPDGKRALTANEYSHDLSVIDTDPLDVANYNQVIFTVGGAIFTSPEGIAITPCGKAYVTDEAQSAVYVWDVTQDPPRFITGPISVDRRPEGIATTPDGTRAYVTNACGNCVDGTVTVIDTATDMVVGDPIVVGQSPQGIAFTPDGRFAYVANSGSPYVSVLDTYPPSPTYNTEIARVTLGSGSYGVAVTGTRCYVSHQGYVSVIDTLTNTLALPDLLIGASDHLLGVAITPNGTRTYVADQVGGPVGGLRPLATKVLCCGPGGGAAKSKSSVRSPGRPTGIPSPWRGAKAIADMEIPATQCQLEGHVASVAEISCILGGDKASEFVGSPTPQRPPSSGGIPQPR